MEYYIGCCFSLSGNSGYRYLGDDGTDRCEILHYGTYRSRAYLLHFWGGTPGIPKYEILGLKFGHLTEYLENGKSQRYMSIRRRA